jgi:uncharacterized protein
MSIKQNHLDTLRRLATQEKVVVIYGARRTGKTTLVNEFLKEEHDPYLLVRGEDISVQAYLATVGRWKN